MSSDTSPLLSLFTEILAAILLELEEPDLGECRLVCRYLKSILDTPLLYYKRQLSFAGMINGLVGTNAQERSLSARSDTLATYLRSWREAQLCLNEELTDIYHNAILLSGECTPSRSLIVLYERSETVPWCHRLFLPPSAIRRQVQASEWRADDHSTFEQTNRIVGVDHTQDLAIWAIGPNSGHTGDPTWNCLFISLSKYPAPHSDSFADTARLSSFMGSYYVLDAQICGAMVGRVGMIHGYPPLTTVNLFNWKTGEVYANLQYTDFYLIELRFIDKSRVLVTLDDRIRVYIVNDIRVTSDYRIPPRADGWNLSNHSDKFRLESRMPSQDAPETPASWFRPNPSSMIFAIFFTTVQQTARWCPVTDQERFLLLAPCLALAPESSLHHDDPPPETVEWDQWGPEGSRLFCLREAPCSISALGSRCAVAFTRTDEVSKFVDIFLIDLLPSARNQSHMVRDGDMFDRYFYSPDEMDDVESLRGTLRTTLPYRTMYKQVRYDDLEEGEKVEVQLSDDGLYVLSQFRSGHNGGMIHSFFI